MEKFASLPVGEELPKPTCSFFGISVTVSPDVYEPDFPPTNSDILTLYNMLKRKFSMPDVGRKIQNFFPVLNNLDPKNIGQNLKRKAQRVAKLKSVHNYKRSSDNKKLNKFMMEKWDLVSIATLINERKLIRSELKVFGFLEISIATSYHLCLSCTTW